MQGLLRSHHCQGDVTYGNYAGGTTVLGLQASEENTERWIQSSWPGDMVQPSLYIYVYLCIFYFHPKYLLLNYIFSLQADFGFSGSGSKISPQESLRSQYKPNIQVWRPQTDD